MALPQASETSRRSVTEVLFSASNIWRTGFVVAAVIALALFFGFILDDGGSVIFTVLMAWFASIAMEPAVSRLATHMRRGAATMIVMVTFAIAAVLFSIAFGKLFIDQIVQLVEALPGLIDEVIAWVNRTFHLTLDVEKIKESVNFTPEQASKLATKFAGEALLLLGSILSSVFGLFTFGLFTFYLSADGPRFRRWVASLFPARAQTVAIDIWDITAEKTGGYVSARVILAALNSASTAVVFLVIGMPSWLALAIWTGVVAQFVPTIGTYISIVLPVIVGLLSPNPWVGVIALVWAILYQQVENLTFEPRISARAVNVHPAVAFGSVLMGAALFGVAGAFLAVPVTAMLLALMGIYVRRHELLPEVANEPDPQT